MFFPIQRYTVENLAIGNITAVTSLLVAVTLAGQQLAAGDGVQVTLRSTTAMTNGITFYGVVVSATQIGIVFVNASAGAIDPADTFDFDIYVLKKSGNPVASS